MAVTLKKPKRKVFIALPCYSGAVELLTHKSLIHDTFRLALSGVETRIFDEVGHADIYLLRAQIVAHFLADKSATDLVMIDSDIGWEPLGLQKLLSHDVDVVAGAYPKREEPLQFMFRSERDVGGDLVGDAATGLVEVWGMPGGFMRITRRAAEKMRDHYTSELEAVCSSAPGGKLVRMFDPYWMNTEDGRMVLSEDYAFCQRWRDIGGKVYMDASISLAHIGRKVYMGRLGDFVGEQKDAAE